MKEKEQGIDNRSSVTSRIKKTIRSYVLYTKKTIEDRIHTIQKNRGAILMKLLYNKSSFEKKRKFFIQQKRL